MPAMHQGTAPLNNYMGQIQGQPPVFRAPETSSTVRHQGCPVQMVRARNAAISPLKIPRQHAGQPGAGQHSAHAESVTLALLYWPVEW